MGLWRGCWAGSGPLKRAELVWNREGKQGFGASKQRWLLCGFPCGSDGILCPTHGVRTASTHSSHSLQAPHPARTHTPHTAGMPAPTWPQARQLLDMRPEPKARPSPSPADAPPANSLVGGQEGPMSRGRLACQQPGQGGSLSHGYSACQQPGQGGPGAGRDLLQLLLNVN